MKFKKVIIDGKEYYRPVDEAVNEAVKNTENEEPNEEIAEEIVEEIVEGEIEDSEELSGGEKFKRDAQDFFGKVKTGAEELGAKIATGAKELGSKIATGAKKFGKKIKEDTERLFNKDKTFDPNSTEAKLLKLLPYMSEEETHEVCLKLLSSDESVAKLNVGVVMPFFSKDDADAIFKKSIELGNEDYDLSVIVPYVSDTCLSNIVDGYIEGKYPNLDIDSFYPFLGDADIKRLFYHIINEEKNGSAE